MEYKIQELGVRSEKIVIIVFGLFSWILDSLICLVPCALRFEPSTLCALPLYNESLTTHGRG